MTDEMWTMYGREQQKNVVGRQAWWSLGNIACNTIEELSRIRVEKQRVYQAWVDQQLGA
jgi:hypothetical protein